MASSQMLKKGEKYPPLRHKQPSKSAPTGQLLVWLDWNSPKPNNYKFEFNIFWAACYNAINVYELQGKGQNIYYEWEIDPNREDAFWRAINPSAEIRDVLLEHPRQTRPVYVEATRGHPLGYYMYQLSGDTRRLWSLIIASRGKRNNFPCQKCDKRYRSAIGGLDPTSPTSVMWPFFECISLTGWCRDGCANCIWGDMNSCTYNDSAYKPYVGSSTMPEKLDFINSPRGRRIQDKLGSLSQIIQQQGGENNSSCSPQ